MKLKKRTLTELSEMICGASGGGGSVSDGQPAHPLLWGRVIIALALIAGAAYGGHQLGWW